MEQDEELQAAKAEIERLRQIIDNANCPQITLHGAGIFGDDMEDVYICPFCDQVAQTLDNLRYCHADDCPRALKEAAS